MTKHISVKVSETQRAAVKALYEHWQQEHTGSQSDFMRWLLAGYAESAGVEWPDDIGTWGDIARTERK